MDIKQLEKRHDELVLLINNAKALRDANLDNRDLYHKYWTELSLLEAELRIVNFNLQEASNV